MPMWPEGILGRGRYSFPGRSDLEKRFGLLASTQDRAQADRRTLADSGVISHMPVSGQLGVSKPHIHNHWLAFRRSSFLDDKLPVHAKDCFRQLNANIPDSWDCGNHQI